ncbi:MAG: hypothetical protein HKN41_05095 [Ilumatobacter sp.]|nr:hypothetical protein [Ilumatobacter sp.]
MGPDGSEQLVRFDEPKRFDVVAVSEDRSRLAVLGESSSTLQWLDVTDPSSGGTLPVDPASTPQQIAFVDGGRRLVVTEGAGITTWDLATGAVDFVALDRSPGAGAVANGSFVVPLLKSDELAVTAGGDVDLRRVDLGEDGTVLEVKATSSGGHLAVRAGRGPTDFDRLDSIVVVDAESMTSVARVETERPLNRDDWAVVDDAVAFAEDASLSIEPIGGGETVTTTALDDDRVTKVLAVDGDVVTVHGSGAIVRWQSPEWQPEHLGAAELPVADVAVGAAGITTVDLDGGVITWSLETGERDEIDGFDLGEVTAAAFSADGAQVGLATSAGRAFVLDGGFGEAGEAEVVAAGAPSARVDTIAFNPADGTLVTGLAERLGSLAFDDSVDIWGPELDRPIATIGGEAEDVAGCSFYFNRVEFTPDGELITTISHDFSVDVHDAGTGAYLTSLGPLESTILDTAISAGGDLFVAAADDGTVVVWDLVDYSEIARYRSVSGGLQAVEILADDATLVVADLTGRLLTIDMMTGAELEVLDELGRRTNSLALSPDRELVAAPRSTGEIGIWSTSGQGRLGVIAGLASSVNDLSFSPAGDLLAVAERAGTASLWELDVARA